MHPFVLENGAAVDPGAIPLADDGKTHEVRLVLGAVKRTPTASAEPPLRAER